MKRLETIDAVRTFRQGLGGTVGFVPTMGALHEGHLSLIKQSCADNDTTIASIYVNATQFNNPNDLKNYPNTLDADLAQMASAGVAAVFLPDYDMMYPDNFQYRVDEETESKTLCGEHRPGHFTGVLTVVMKLLNLVDPDHAYFGEKDYQQLSLIQGMAEAFFLRAKVVGCPIVRESDGLAMSSRNLNLNLADRAAAHKFHAILNAGCSDQEVEQELVQEGFEVDYVETKNARRFGAVLMGNAQSPVRLIDNVAVG